MIFLGILFGVLSMIGYGLVNAYSKKAAHEVGPIHTIFYRNVLVSILLFCAMLFLETSYSFSWYGIFVTVLISVLGYIPVFLFYQAIQRGKVGVVVPVANSSIIFSVLFSLVFFKEVLFVHEYVSILLIVFGVLVVSVNFADLRRSSLFSLRSGVPLAFLAAFFWGLVYFLFKIPVDLLGPYVAAFIIECVVMIVSGIHMLLLRRDSRAFPRNSIPLIGFLAVCLSVGTLFYTLGVSQAPVSIVSSLAFANPLVAALVAFFAFGERLTLREYVAVGCIVAGICVLSF